LGRPIKGERSLHWIAEMKEETKRRAVKWLMIFGLWTAAAIYFASMAVTQSRLGPRPLSIWRALSWELTSGYVWFLLMPLILWLGARFPFERSRWKTSLPVHLVACIVVACGQQAIDALILPKLGYPRTIKFNSYGDTYRYFLLANLHLSVGLYWATLGVLYAYNFYHKYRERELRASQLEARLAQTKLQVLKMQLHPHFLFNTLNAISELVYRDPEIAEHMITNLSDLLRISLDNVGVQEVPLQQELDFLNKYLEIEQTRFHDRLQLQMSIDPDTLDASVPNMILQPLVENAIKHGIGPRSAGGRIEIAAHRSNGTLHMRVSDDGRGLPNGEQAALREGVGLANTRARLAHLYGSNHNFELISSPHTGLTLELEIPFRIAPVGSISLS
jgi:two-component system LytT family sensor kinase